MTPDPFPSEPRNERRVIVCVHWSDAGAPADVDAACEAMRPLKAEGTRGFAGAFDEAEGREFLSVLAEAGWNVEDERHA